MLISYGGRDDILEQTLLKYTRIFGCQKVVDSPIEIKRRFCKHDLNFMNSGVHSLTITTPSNPCPSVLFASQPVTKSIKERA